MKRVVRFKDLGYLGLKDDMPLDITKAMGGQGLIKLLDIPESETEYVADLRSTHGIVIVIYI